LGCHKRVLAKKKKKNGDQEKREKRIIFTKAINPGQRWTRCTGPSGKPPERRDQKGKQAPGRNATVCLGESMQKLRDVGKRTVGD